MSSILKALQRLQGDRGGAASPEPQPALRDELARQLTATETRASDADQRARVLRLRALAAVGGAVLIVLAAAGWWLARGSPAVPAPATAPVAAPAPAPPAVAEVIPQPPPTPVQERSAERAAVAAAAPVDAMPAQAPAPASRIRIAPPAQPSGPPEEQPVLAMPRTAFEPLPSASPPPVASEPPEAAPAEAEAPSGEPEALDPTASAEPAAALEPAVAAGIEEPRIELIPERAAAQAPGAAEVLPSATAPFQPAPAVARTAGPPSAPGIEVLRTTWHPRPERRVARVRLAGRPAPLDVHEGDAVSTLVVKTIEPSGVLFLHGSQELRRGVGER